ncbi:hypothetical protein HZC00_02500 [Candidatus Kaiserbacteria bacterium]|nr:hypothetical protein [Candidatus Kaiserbacteria bacterium]
MNTTMKTKMIAIVSMLLMLGMAAPAFALDINLGGSAGANARVAASTTAGTKVSATLSARIQKGKTKAEEEISRRITALGSLNDRVQAMARVSGDWKSSISTTVRDQIASLSTLQAKIDGDIDLDTLKADIKSIAESYRIFMLVLPQGRITTAADHIQIAAGTFTTLSGKLAARINDAQGSGHDVADMSASLADMNAKIAEANTQAAAATTAVSSLKPDGGDKTIVDSNKAALKDAQSKLKAARDALQAARKSAGDIVKALKEMNANASASASTTTTVQ